MKNMMWKPEVMNTSRKKISSIPSTDVGSLPCATKLSEAFDENSSIHESSMEKFKQAVVNSYVDKLKAGIAVPTFPQFRDMNQMFLSAFEGIAKVKEGLVQADIHLKLKSGFGLLSEVAAIKEHSETIKKQIDQRYQLRICVTGPYTLASFFPHRNHQIYREIGRLLTDIVDRNTFSIKDGEVALLAIDEPLFGFIDDSLIERNTAGREELLKGWETIAQKAKTKNIQSCIHLHSTSDSLFWEPDSISIIESHVDDPIYTLKTTKDQLESKDKFLKASIARSDFDLLIEDGLRTESALTVPEAWKHIIKGTMKAERFLEEKEIMEKRLKKIVNHYGIERVAMAGPECGLRGFPTYASAISCLRDVSEVSASTVL
jgi:5-methyltetrahydropteroyltriglutamate--homocysteine methyltransferase